MHAVRRVIGDPRDSVTQIGMWIKAARFGGLKTNDVRRRQGAYKRERGLAVRRAWRSCKCRANREDWTVR